MSMTDPVSDLLTRIRNATSVRHDRMDVPASKMKLEIAKILKQEGYIRTFKMIEEGPQGTIRIYLKYADDGETVVGVDFDDKGHKQKHAIDREDFTGNPSYQTLANEYIEPAIRVRYNPVSFDGTRIGVFEIGDCQDRPYMMRIDYSETLRRGDAYKRVNNAPIKMGRRQLMELFERKFG